MKNLISPENEAEALAMSSLLRQQGIKSQVISFHDTAYDGLFQAQYGWGVIRVEEADFALARRIVEEWKASSPSELPWNEDQGNSD